MLQTARRDEKDEWAPSDCRADSRAGCIAGRRAERLRLSEPQHPAVVDTSPGGLTDLLARLCADGLAQKLAQPVVVDNKPGASGNVATEFVVRSAPDGYTLMIGAGGNLVVKPFLEQALAFDPLN